MIHKLLFDTTDVNTQNDSANVGAYLRSSDGTLITHTTDGARQAVDVFTELGQAEDSAHTSGDIGAMALVVRNDTPGSLVDTDGDYSPLQVDASGNLRVVGSFVSNTEYAEDSAHTSGDVGNYVLTVRQDTLAISTDADGDYSSFKTNDLGALYTISPTADALLTTIDADTSAIALSTASIDTEIQALSHLEDSAHVSGDAGVMGLAVRNDTLASLVDTDGDYAPLQVNADGALYVSFAGGDDPALANTAIANAANALDVANTAEDVVAAPLADRKYLWIYNNGNREAYIGSTGVTSSNGFPMPPGSILEMRLGSAVDIEWVSSNTAQELRTLEIS
jgi:hypothetical protein